MTEKEHLERIDAMCVEIENNIKNIKLTSKYLEEYYGIMVTDASVLSGLSVHVYAGLELIEKALKKKAVENEKIFRYDNTKRKFVSHGVEWFQLAQPYGEKWLVANLYDNARYDLRAGGANNDKP